MDYEKKYKDALERANSAHKDEDRHLKATLERIFPELRESEDERIRKEIVSAINIYCSEYLRGTKVRNDMLAWVEKQGELVNSLSKGLDNAHERIDELIQKNNKLCIKLEQKSAWSEKDENFFADICTIIDADRNFTESAKRRCKDWLKSLKDRVQPQDRWKPSEEQMKQLGWIAEQNKDNMIGKELISLYQDLKKLREE